MFTNESIFQKISIDEFKTSGNLSLSTLQLTLVNPIKTIYDTNERSNIIQRNHDDPIFGGHPGTKRLLAKLKHQFTWKNMYKDVKDYVGKCQKCQLAKPKNKNVELLEITPTPQKPFDVMIIDTIGPMMKSEFGNTYAITMMCDLTKYLVTATVTNKEANTVAKAIFEKFILIYGPMREMRSDKGTEYVNSIIKELCKMLKIEHNTSVPYHHQTLGTVERNHRVFNEYLRSYLSEQSQWETYLQYFTFCYNTTHHTSFNHQFTPYELVFAKNHNSVEVIMDNKIDPIYDVENFAKEAKYRLQTTNLLAKELLEKTKIRSKKQYDKTANPIDININDKVMLSNENRHKHDPLYKGPFIVTNINSPNVTITDPKTNQEKTVHKNNIRKYI